MSFSDIPVRSNGETVTAAWFNTIRTELIATYGSGAISETQITIANNTGPSNVTGLLYAGATYASFTFEYYARRTTDDFELVESGKYQCTYKATAGTWSISHLGGDGDAEIDFTIVNATGQIQFTTSNLTGANYSGKLRFKATALSEVS